MISGQWFREHLEFANMTHNFMKLPVAVKRRTRKSRKSPCQRKRIQCDLYSHTHSFNVINWRAFARNPYHCIITVCKTL